MLFAVRSKVLTRPTPLHSNLDRGIPKHNSIILETHFNIIHLSFATRAGRKALEGNSMEPTGWRPEELNVSQTDGRQPFWVRDPRPGRL